YKSSVQAPTVYNGQLWFVSQSPKGKGTSFNSAPLVPKSGIAAIEKLDAEKLLAVKPGMQVAIALPDQGTAESDRLKDEWEDHLIQEGFEVVPESNVRLVGAVGAPSDVAFHYRPFGEKGFRQATGTGRLVRLSWTVDGKPVWMNERRTLGG